MYSYFLNYLFLTIPLFKSSVFASRDSSESSVVNYKQKWPKYDNFGQISGVGVDSEGFIYIFHRGNRQWNFNTFNENVFADKDKGPIPNETIVVINPVNGSLITKAAANFFYLPHGLTIDNELNIWLTDVAMHQIFKFPPLILSHKTNPHWKPILKLGTFLEPGKDNSHFCKPTSVAVDSTTKEFFVSDGYCNARIIKFDSSGNKLLEWGKMANGFSKLLSGYMLSVPHSVVLDEKKKVIYVADREHFRIVSYDSVFGKFQKSLALEFKSRIFSVALHGGFLFALTNNGTSSKSVLVFDLNSDKYLTSFVPQNGFTNPHDIAISPDGQFCYVVELKPYTIWKINISEMKKSLPQEDYTKSKLDERIEEPLPAESKIEKNSNFEMSSSFLAMSLVISVVVISFLFFMFHYYKRKAGYRRHETRRLILDDDEGGIQLT